MSLGSLDVTMKQCPRYHACSAPLCPLDLGLSERKMLPGEALCLLLREWAKLGGRERLTSTLPEWQCRMVGEAFQRLSSSEGPAKKALRRASGQGSKIAAGKVMKQASKMEARCEP